MSDPKSSYGEPVEEPNDVDDVVGRANEGLADAEAARRDPSEETSDAATESTADAPAPEATSDPVDAPAAESATADVETPAEAEAPDAVASAADAPAADTSAADARAEADKAWADEYASLGGEPVAPAAAAPAAATTADEPATVAYDAAPATVAPSEPVSQDGYAAAGAAGAAATTAYAPQPIFVQAPEAPRPRGNRAAAGAIGLLAALSFGILYLTAWLGFGALTGDVTTDNVGTSALDALGTWSLWVPVVVFYIAFWLLGAIINRGRWGAWVIFGLFVGIAAYGGHILGALFQAPFWTLTASQGAELVEGELLAPLAIASFVIARELTIWFGTWVSARGKRVTELNTEAQREYERTLEAGPQLVQQ
ncbi:ABC transporter [Microbacterium sp. C7(2022)]|uniref:ABC transporter n=1 Tax=Microbacterium sp. C7(2022) TaxID=2992759 RepID=UPI00237A3320|nr:ABC transporter [Microbacterium sp. C7(2022)]MDE0545301.1 ABC transporter [Microbacterium sp. C7(2022)]